jgi:hypothetical protein
MFPSFKVWAAANAPDTALPKVSAVVPLSASSTNSRRVNAALRKVNFFMVSSSNVVCRGRRTLRVILQV